MEDYKSWIGQKVVKKSGKKFKSKLEVNTVKDVGIHPIIFQKQGIEIPCFTFHEDDSYVRCDICEIVIIVKFDTEGITKYGQPN